MRIAVGGIWAECSELSHVTLTTKDFVLEEGDSLKSRWEKYAPISAEIVPLSFYRSLPGGFLRGSSYAILRDNILKKLEAVLPVDAIILELHGALGVGGLVDPEAYFVGEIRQLVGDDVVIGCAMDLHGSVSDDLFEKTDVITCNRTSPHTDDDNVRQRLIAKVAQAVENGKPIKCKYSLNAVFSGEMTSTEISPAKEIWESLGKEEASVDLFVGYPWSSDPRHMLSCVAYGTENFLDVDSAKYPIQAMFKNKDKFKFASKLLTLPVNPEFFKDADRLPIYLSDVSDNTGAGSEGSSTTILDSLCRTLRHLGLKAFAGPFCGFENLDTFNVGDPIRISPCFVGHVMSKFIEPDGSCVIIAQQSDFWALASEKRRQLSEKEDFEAFGLNLEDFDVVLLKMGYLEPYPKSLAKTHRLVLGPGSVNPNLFEVQKLLGTESNNIWVPGKHGVKPEVFFVSG